MAAARTALDILKTHGDRTATRLRSLVEHFAAYYGEDPESEFEEALERARSSVIGFIMDQQHDQ